VFTYKQSRMYQEGSNLLSSTSGATGVIQKPSDSSYGITTGSVSAAGTTAILMEGDTIEFVCETHFTTNPQHHIIAVNSVGERCAEIGPKPSLNLLKAWETETVKVTTRELVTAKCKRPAPFIFNAERTILVSQPHGGLVYKVLDTQEAIEIFADTIPVNGDILRISRTKRSGRYALNSAGKLIQIK
jgi:hypothetical protein